MITISDIDKMMNYAYDCAIDDIIEEIEKEDGRDIKEVLNDLKENYCFRREKRVTKELELK